MENKSVAEASSSERQLALLTGKEYVGLHGYLTPGSWRSMLMICRHSRGTASITATMRSTALAFSAIVQRIRTHVRPALARIGRWALALVVALAALIGVKPTA